MTSGPRKGSQFERDICKQLSLWITGGKDQTQLVRSIQSGGWVNNANNRHTGDVGSNGPIGEEFRKVFALELKNRMEFDWKHLWTLDSPKMIEWWDKLINECKDNKGQFQLVPLIVVKRNFVPTVIGYPFGMRPSIEIFPRMTLMYDNTEWMNLVKLEDLVKTDPDWFIDEGKVWLEQR